MDAAFGMLWLRKQKWRRPDCSPAAWPAVSLPLFTTWLTAFSDTPVWPGEAPLAANRCDQSRAISSRLWRVGDSDGRGGDDGVGDCRDSVMEMVIAMIVIVMMVVANAVMLS